MRKGGRAAPRSAHSPGSPRRSTPIAEAATVLIAVLAAAVFARRAAALLLSYPVPWPDEALFADAARGLLRRGAMGTQLYQEALPGLSQHYYLTPPLYPLLLSAVFAMTGFGLVPMRMASLLTAVAVLVLVHTLGRRTGLGPWLALLPPSLFALDAVFLRGALVGRMDMLALGFVLLTLWLLLPPLQRPATTAPRESRARSWGVGLAAAAALLSHPMGTIAPAAALAALMVPGVIRFARRDGERAQARSAGAELRAGPVLLGLLAGLLPWAFYVMLDPPGFVEQFGLQLVRKSARNFWGTCLPMSLAQWGVGALPVALMWLGGLTGLAAATRAGGRVGVLAIGQLAMIALALASCEMWYGLYVMPLGYLGIAHGMRGSIARGVRRWIAGAAFAGLALWFALRNAEYLSRVERQASGGAYASWCQRIGEQIAPGSTVLMDGLPTPYFGLVDRSDLKLRFFPPQGFDLSPRRLEQTLEAVDVVISGPSFANAPVRELADRRGVSVSEVGPAQGFRFYARIIRIEPESPKD